MSSRPRGSSCPFRFITFSPMLIPSMESNQNYHHHLLQISKNSGIREYCLCLSLALPILISWYRKSLSLPRLYPLSFTCHLFFVISPVLVTLQSLFQKKNPNTSLYQGTWIKHGEACFILYQYLFVMIYTFSDKEIL